MALDTARYLRHWALCQNLYHETNLPDFQESVSTLYFFGSTDRGFPSFPLQVFIEQPHKRGHKNQAI